MALEQGRELLLGILEARGLGLAGVLKLDDMPSELSLDGRFRIGAFLHRGDGLGEGGHHLVGVEPFELAAVLAGRSERMLSGQIAEIGAAVELLDHVFRLFLVLDEDVACLVLGLAGVFLDLLVSLLQLVFGWLDLLGHRGQYGIGEDLHALQLDRDPNVGVLLQIAPSGLLGGNHQAHEVVEGLLLKLGRILALTLLQALQEEETEEVETVGCAVDRRDQDVFALRLGLRVLGVLRRGCTCGQQST